MSRKWGQTDRSQGQIVADLRKIGATVHSLHRVGMGCPDLLVGYQGKNYLMEIKNAGDSPSKQALRKTQVEFFDSWRGQCAKVTTTDEAFDVIGLVSLPIRGAIS